MGEATERTDRLESADAETLVGRGFDWLSGGEPDRAIEEFDASLLLDPEHGKAFFGRGQAWRAKGEFARSLRDLDEAVRLKPDDSEVLGYRAYARHRLGDFMGAVADFDRAIDIAPQVAWLYNGRGTSLHADDELEAAVADYKRAIALNPNYSEPFRNQGMALAANGEYEAAIPSYTEAIRLNPADPLSHLYRAEARCQVEDFEAAVIDFGEAIRLDPKQVRAYQGRAAAWEALEQDEEAEADYVQAERLGEDEPMGGAAVAVTERKPQIHALIQAHFDPTPVEDLTITERNFPHRVRADLQRAIDRVFVGQATVSFFCGVRKTHAFDGISLTELLVRNRHNPSESVPPLYEEINIGEEQPVRCLKNGLWLVEADETRFVVFLEQHTQFHKVEGMRIQVAAPNDPQGFRVSQDFLNRLEEAVQKAESYRGKILSLEQGDNYSGKSSGILVHRLSTVEREQVILPSSTLELLERNVVRFIGLRPRLNKLGLATKKGLLFYGPPGTGKTHTIHYLAGALKGHTTLLITAEQVGLLGEYMALARLLQPSMVVIEDVDLIARDRMTMGSPCEEVLLNKLLNEMDGLRPDSEILFVLTTNRPEALEAALASRPGRVDQAIEFPLPDDEGRMKLVRLYARGVEVPEDVVRGTVKRTEGVSASFIKELMRRSTQFHLERTDTGRLGIKDVEAALDELLFSGGTLNRKLLGGKNEESEGCLGRS
jgi:tetratricopeptide (TPR) repeat protein